MMECKCENLKINLRIEVLAFINCLCDVIILSQTTVVFYQENKTKQNTTRTLKMPVNLAFKRYFSSRS